MADSELVDDPVVEDSVSYSKLVISQRYERHLEHGRKEIKLQAIPPLGNQVHWQGNLSRFFTTFVNIAMLLKKASQNTTPTDRKDYIVSIFFEIGGWLEPCLSLDN